VILDEARGVMLRLKPVLSLVEGKHGGPAFTRRTSTELSVTPLLDDSKK